MPIVSFILNNSILSLLHNLIVKIFLFQAIYFTQIVLIQTIQFSNKYTVSSIKSIDRVLSGPAIQGSAFPKAPGSLEPHHPIV